MQEPVKLTPSSGNVFLDLGFPPHEAIVLSMRSDLMCKLAIWIRDSGLTQQEIAEQLETTQARVSDLVRGKYNKFRLDMLISMAVRVGIPCELKVAA